MSISSLPPRTPTTLLDTPEAIRAGFEAERYICSSQVATTVYLAYHLQKGHPVSARPSSPRPLRATSGCR